MNALSLIFIYKIGEITWDKRMGIIALCFSQNQVFFDPVIMMNWFRTEKHLWDYDPDWFVGRIVDEQCRVTINDYRTGVLHSDVKKKIGQNYIAIKTGDILIPGFVIPSGQSYIKKVWIAGDYYSSTTSLEIDGEKIRSNVMYLEQKEYLHISQHHGSARFIGIYL